MGRKLRRGQAALSVHCMRLAKREHPAILCNLGHLICWDPQLALIIPWQLSACQQKSLKVDGQVVNMPVLLHRQIVMASLIEFEMASEPQTWGSGQ